VHRRVHSDVEEGRAERSQRCIIPDHGVVLLYKAVARLRLAVTKRLRG
jgi:hypothetical protein